MIEKYAVIIIVNKGWQQNLQQPRGEYFEVIKYNTKCWGQLKQAVWKVKYAGREKNRLLRTKFWI